MLKRLLQHHPDRLFFFLSTCLVLFFYRHVFGAGFVYDDVNHILNNPALLSWRAVFSHYFERGVPFGSDYLAGPAASFYRPLFWLSLALDRALFGLKPLGFHLTNLLFHLVNGWLAFLLLKRLGVPVERAAAVILVWLILPINSEAVAWISGRTYCLSTLFILLSLLFAEHYLRAGSGSAMLGYGFGSTLAILSHETGLLVLPFILLVAFSKRKLFSPSCGLLCTVGIGIEVAYFGLRRILHIPSPVHFSSLRPVGLILGKYIQWMLLPIHMSVERSSDTPAHYSPLSAALALFAVIFVCILAFYLRRKMPEFAAGIAWMGIAVLPYCGIVFIYQGMAERYTYLASLGLALAIVSLAWISKPKIKYLCSLLCLGWIAWGAWRLNSRVLDWRNEISLYSSSLKADPNSPVLLYNLGAALQDAGDLRNAFLLTQRAITVRPDYERAINGLGTIYLQAGLLKQAKATFEHALSLNPVDETALCNLGTVFLQAGRFYEASVRFARALALQPDDVRALTNLGAAKVRLGDLDAARHAFLKIIALAPNDNEARCNLAMVLFEQGKWDEAVAQLAAAIKRNPSDANPFYFLGIIDAKMGARDSAIQMLRRAIQLKPGYAAAQAKLRELTRKQ